MTRCISVAAGNLLRSADAAASARGLSQRISEHAFNGFHQRTAPALGAYIARLSRDPALAEDVVQEAYLRFLQTSHADASEDHLRSYLYRIATNLVMDHWRRGRRDRAWRLLRTAEAPPRLPGTVSLDVSRALATLRPRERALLWLAYVEGFEHSEIARILGVREKGIRVMLFRSRKRLARILSPESSGAEVGP